MKEKLEKLLENSYSPYSNYKVSCIVVMKDGKEFNGVNVENASYGATLCAERTAIFSAIANGYKRYDFKELYVICRQVISELFEKNCKCIFMNIDGKEEIHTVEEICPFPFDDDNLK